MWSFTIGFANMVTKIAHTNAEVVLRESARVAMIIGCIFTCLSLAYVSKSTWYILKGLQVLKVLETSQNCCPFSKPASQQARASTQWELPGDGTCLMTCELPTFAKPAMCDLSTCHTNISFSNSSFWCSDGSRCPSSLPLLI